MPDITVYLNDELYTKFKSLPMEDQRKLKEDFKEAIEAHNPKKG